ncbi:MAG: hypothetical protein R3C10_22785 [Pirellulales bacterium]
MGKTIMISSHILPELADICNKIGIIELGELQVNANVADVMKQVRGQVVLDVGVAGDIEAAGRVLEQHDLVESVTQPRATLLVTLVAGAEDYSELPTLLIEAGQRITLFKEEELNLETAFMTLTKGITS